MPCVTVDADAAAEIMRRVEADPSIVVAVDLAGLRVTAGDYSSPVALPAAARESFLDGSWDATGLLLDRYDEIEAVAARLPYISNWSA
jgi:3-isopropylmalate/(R)-2-methylmalate dehydratase small subunit